MMNSFTEQEKLELYAQQIHESGIDITPDQKNEWTMIAYACASQGEAGREPFHLICSNYTGYSREECDKHFSYCLKTNKNCVSLGTLVKIAHDHGLELRLPRGRRSKSPKQQEEEQKNRMVKMSELLCQQADWRFNVWRQRPEVKEHGQDWRPVQDRDLDTFYCRLLGSGQKVKQQDVKAMIFNRDFCTDYDVFTQWLHGLKPWNPDTDPDYLDDFYRGHLEFVDPTQEDLCVSMLKKWHVGMVELILGRSDENPLMPIFKGKQHIGKTYFVRHILPSDLRDYRLEVGPADRIDKDFIISLSETPLIIFDEISFGNNQKNEAFKYIVTSNKSNVRDAYARFREPRKRRASLIATTNEDNFIPNTDGTRRYLVVDLKDTVDLDNFPLPYEGAYAQALYLIEHNFHTKPNQDESLLISRHNQHYAELNDCEEVLVTILQKPDSLANTLTMSAGDILNYLSSVGQRGLSFRAHEIGKAMKHLGFESKTIRGKTKYLVVKKDYDTRNRENEADVQAFIPEVF